MYCSTCGSSINDTLKYCKNCGVKLVKDDEKEDTPESILDNLLMALCFVAIFGFAFLVGLVAILLDKVITHQIVVLIVVIYLVGAVWHLLYALEPSSEIDRRKIEQEIRTRRNNSARAALRQKYGATRRTARTCNEHYGEHDQNA